ncbi:NAD(P)H-quinone oxidoreductase subunit 1 [Alkalidesulfovibrio alkalitolerans DSM 16529]|jgi:NADH-quinone oxidoreductase subunit H|uniref:NADH-quinone oxidoreductase subunit H n=1 Tax=Alkalidesulfovibrio alkalitolerans DSM 16529 TaxID=1121439 RepID=S7UN03_9BACT|nr:NADH-quinone oxidoreductase subunit NuoH [Alkalidesulfovibrio alkalitolerans]EPR35354.1 NAD(P)H-quinone oxidoreductase subunit 1 [Alkalidesulfovibrio alkalitolerans DSM 16529]
MNISSWSSPDPNVALVIPDPLVRLLVGLLALAAFVGLNATVLVYVERKVAGFIQRRPGPYEVGPHGILQTLADAVKLVGKQLSTPRGADFFLFWLAPIMAFLPVFVMFLPIPFGENLYALETNVGLLLILAYAGLNVLALCLAGWASANKWGLIGAARAVAQSVGYEIPLLLSLLAVCFTHGSLDLMELTRAQGPWPWQWNVAIQPLAFFIYFVCALAETNRAPFDLPEAESELTAGFHTEYSGMGFGLFFLAEYANMIVVCAIATAVFLGGFQGPAAPGPWWFLLKVYSLLLIMMWMRWTYPRVRFDQLLNLNWKWLLPLATLNLLATAVIMKL